MSTDTVAMAATAPGAASSYRGRAELTNQMRPAQGNYPGHSLARPSQLQSPLPNTLIARRRGTHG